MSEFFLCLIIVAVVVLVALYLKDSVIFSGSFWGARVHLEAKKDKRK